jgi:Peptidase family M23
MAWYSGYQHPLQAFFWTWGNEKAHSGIDLPDSCGTPLTAILPGKVIIAGQYPCYGGQVSIQSTFAGQPIVYTYLHGQSHNVKVGDTVHPGQLIGYSGAPVAAACGGGCHVHFEVEHGTQAPYTGGPPQNSSASNYPINPVPLLAYAVTGKISAGGTPASPLTTKTGSSTTTLADSSASKSSTCTPPTSVNPADWIQYLACQFLGNVGSLAATVGPWLNPIRIAKLVVGVLLVGIGLLVLIIPVTAPIGAAVTATALGAPELAPAAASAAHSLTHRGPKAPPPSPSQAVPAAIGAAGQTAQRRTVQRSYTTRNLGGQAPMQGAPTTRNLGGNYGPPPSGPATPSPKPPTPKPPSTSPMALPNVLGPGFKPNPNYVPPVARAPVTSPNRGLGQLGTPANPMSREEIAAIQANKPLPAVPVSRGPKTGLVVPRAAPATQPLTPPAPAKRVNAKYGARTVMTQAPIPDVNVENMRAFIASGQPINFTGIPPGEQGREQVRKRVNRQTARVQSRMTEDELMQIPIDQRTKQTIKRLAEYERLQRRTAFTPIDETLRRLRGEE